MNSKTERKRHLSNLSDEEQMLQNTAQSNTRTMVGLEHDYLYGSIQYLDIKYVGNCILLHCTE
jgi:hypothetical protein